MTLDAASHAGAHPHLEPLADPVQRHGRLRMNERGYQRLGYAFLPMA
jgi:hypothetical protein